MGVDKRLDDMPDGWSESVLRQLPVSLVVSDPRQADNPIIFVNSAFEKTTGYSANEVLGQNCRFLQGEETDPADIASLREAIANQAEISLDILNYRKSGEAFINRLMISPVTSPEGELVYFIGFQYEHQDQKTYMDRARELDGRLREIQHRVKNHLSMIVSLIRIQAGRLEPRDAAAMMAKRVETIGLLYEQVDVAQRNADQTIDMAAYLDKVCGAVSGLSNEIEVELKRAEGTVYFPVEDAARLGQIVSEIVTNAMQHAFTGTQVDEKRITVEVSGGAGDLTVRVHDNGRGMGDAKWPEGGGLGGQIVLDLVRRLNGELDVKSSKNGTMVDMRFALARRDAEAGAGT